MKWLIAVIAILTIIFSVIGCVEPVPDGVLTLDELAKRKADPRDTGALDGLTEVAPHHYATVKLTEVAPGIYDDNDGVVCFLADTNDGGLILDQAIHLSEATKTWERLFPQKRIVSITTTKNSRVARTTGFIGIYEKIPVVDTPQSLSRSDQ